MIKYYLAVDIGASSGRHILAHMENGKMVLEEIHRFPNGMIEKDGHKVWDIDGLFKEVKAGMIKCTEMGKIPESIGIDTWAVDYVLLDECGNRLDDAIAYRDSRTKNMDSKVYDVISENELYGRTGIQKQMFNTIYQLMAEKEQNRDVINKADKMLMIPDYLHYLLTGRAAAEYTNATTTQLVNPVTKDWDKELIAQLGLPEKIFPEIKNPGSELGQLTKEIAKEVGFSCRVVLPATHDTGSAVMAVPSNEDDILYISSGTWSLMGTELKEANCSLESMKHNFTNEGGYNYRFRYLKNIMGLWMIQSIKKEIAADTSFAEISDMAAKSHIDSIVDCNDDRFLAPENMTKEVQKACEESGQDVPVDIQDVASVIYNSLANCYGNTIEEIESLTGKSYRQINVVGGGANADYLNRLTAKITGRKVVTGPGEATAIGNIASQMIASKELLDLREARNCIFNSFPVKIYE